ncbi:MAG TPA: FKBP-type peptidyl-prolyl cis-trans isomerase [Bacteroidales bacterium]|nr:FKBP-type peptidyl-prolyl cis-trans isomerase [Bacteroidales bacterium]
MQITKNKVVSLIYELNENGPEGAVIEKVDKSQPLLFIFGRGMLLSKFEDNIEGLSVGDKFSFMIPKEDAYGSIMQEAIIDVPISAFEIDGKIEEGLLTVGNVIPMADENGRPLDGKVISLGIDNVKMDFNHPLAGIDLFFKGEIIDIRDATPEELNHNHLH